MQETDLVKGESLQVPAPTNRPDPFNLSYERIGIVERSGSSGSYQEWLDRNADALMRYDEAIKPEIAKLNALIESGVPQNEAYQQVKIPGLSEYLNDQAA